MFMMLGNTLEQKSRRLSWHNGGYLRTQMKKEADNGNSKSSQRGRRKPCIEYLQVWINQQRQTL